MQRAGLELQRPHSRPNLGRQEGCVSYDHDQRYSQGEARYRASDKTLEGSSAPAKPEINGEEVVVNFLRFIGEDPMRAGIRETPARVVKSWRELYEGYHLDPKKILSKRFDAEDCDEIVLCKNIEFYSTCEHHLLPIVGTAHVGYIPGKGGKVVGLSKLARLVDVYARRLQIQEQMTRQIAKA